MKKFTLAFSLTIFLSLIIQMDLSSQQLKEIDEYASYISERYGIPGMAIGIINNGQVIHRGYYGTYDLETQQEVDQNSLFNLHSLSKVFVNVAIFKLIEEGKIKLEDDVANFIEDYPSQWEITQVKHLLSHSSGLPNIIHFFGNDLTDTKTKLYKATSHFEPGSDFDYNQTNYWLINRIVEKVSNEGFDKTIKRSISNNCGDKLVFDMELADHNLQPKEYRPGKDQTLQMEYSKVHKYMNGAAGININLDDFINWNLKLDNNKLIAAATKNQMWQPFDYTDTSHDFTSGWGIYNSNTTTSVGFSGGGVAGLRKFLKEDLSVIVLTNGYRYGFNVNTFINWMAGQVRPTIIDPSAVLHKNLYKLFKQKKAKTALLEFAEIKSKFIDVYFDPILNSLGYELLAKDFKDQAITVFLLNTKEHPNSWNAWDSLGEGYEITGEANLAIKYYQKSLTLNPKNQHAIDRLEKLGSD